jgi:hypothetical protein
MTGSNYQQDETQLRNLLFPIRQQFNMFRVLCRSSSGTSTVFEPLVYKRLRTPPLVLSEWELTRVSCVVLLLKLWRVSMWFQCLVVSLNNIKCLVFEIEMCSVWGRKCLKFLYERGAWNSQGTRRLKLVWPGIRDLQYRPKSFCLCNLTSTCYRLFTRFWFLSRLTHLSRQNIYT